MPPEARSSHWLQFACDDLKAARVMTREGLHHLACFHAQQAAEKALKAYLIVRRQTVPREHHLVSLLQHCVRKKLRGKNLDRACKILNQYYIPTRYPDAVAGSLVQGLPSRTHALEAIRLAAGLLRTIRRQLPDCK